MTDRPKRNNIPKPRRFQTTSSEEMEEIGSARKTSMGQQHNCQLDDDVAELREVSKNPPNMNPHPDQPQTYTQLSAINNYKEHMNNTSHVNDTTHSFCTQPFTETTQTFSPTFTSHAPTYTQLLNINHTTQTHSNNTLQQLHYAPQNHNTKQTFTHDPHASTHTQHICSGLNIQHDPNLQPSNILLNNSHGQRNISLQTGDFYNVKPEIEG